MKRAFGILIGMMWFVFFWAMALFLCKVSGCQTILDAPKPHFGRVETVLLASDAAVRGLDMYSTHLMLQNGGHEKVLPDFISHHVAVMALYSEGTVALQYWTARKLTAHHHAKLARFMTEIDIAEDVPGAVHNLWVHGPHERKP